MDRDENRVYNENVVRKPFVRKIEEIIREWRLPVNPNLGKITYPCISPWEDFDNINVELIQPVTKAMSDIVLRKATIETIKERYTNFLLIYTDGSKKEQPLSTTAAYCIPDRKIEKSWKLHPNISIEGAELSAIAKASEMLVRTTEDPKSTVILTDSKVGLYLIQQRHPKNYVNGVSIIQKNIRKLINKGWTIKLQWIPSHCGIKGNEEADSLANQAHELTNLDEYPNELKEMEEQVKKAAQRQWELRWNIDKRNCALGDRKTKLEDWKWCRIKDRRLDVTITRLRVEACRLNNNMYKMGLVGSPKCNKCSVDTEETVTHFLIECDSLSEQRRELRRRLWQYGIVSCTTDLLLGNSNEEIDVKRKITHELGRFLLKSKRLDDI